MDEEDPILQPFFGSDEEFPGTVEWNDLADADADTELPPTPTPTTKWTSRDEKQEIERSFHCPLLPKVKDWNDELGSEYSVSVDGSRRFMWTRAKSEIEAIREKHPTFESAFQEVFGANSRLAMAFKKHLDVNYETFCRFFASFYVTSGHMHGLAELEKDTRFDTTHLLSSEDFALIWRKIAHTI